MNNETRACWRWCISFLGVVAVLILGLSAFIFSVIALVCLYAMCKNAFALANRRWQWRSRLAPAIRRWRHRREMLHIVASNFRSRYRVQIRTLLHGLAVGVIACQLSGAAWLRPAQTVSVTEMVADGLEYGRELYKGSRVYYLKVDLERVRPIILTAPALSYGKRTLTRMAVEKGVLAAVNGDFFDEGGPSGFLVSEGRHTSPRQNRAALAFHAGGNRALIEFYRFSTTAQVVANQQPFLLRGSYNMPYTRGEVGIYTHTRGVASGVGKGIVQAKVRLDLNCREGDAKLRGIVVQTVDSPSTSFRPRQGEIVLVAGNESSVPKDMGVRAWAETNLFAGSKVAVSLAVTPKPMPLVISGAPLLLAYGHYVVQERGNEWLAARTARTAVGIAGGGRYLYVVAVEGPPKWLLDAPAQRLALLKARQFLPFARLAYEDFLHFVRAARMRFLAHGLGVLHISSGMSGQELARYLSSREVAGQSIEYALNLDGGSSTGLVYESASGSRRQVVSTMNRREELLATALGFERR